jgi:hypothetical protein
MTYASKAVLLMMTSTCVATCGKYGNSAMHTNEGLMSELMIKDTIALWPANLLSDLNVMPFLNTFVLLDKAFDLAW